MVIFTTATTTTATAATMMMTALASAPNDHNQRDCFHNGNTAWDDNEQQLSTTRYDA